ncbi:hypothetical protein UK23_45070 [Lentzea aerocolonigenes]|uniref:Uncharacterized protein n=2 Tax=Lentzea aerocolonigenes TaxID=68170 RepID=A0A0F0GGB9_LENAE|nr:hypothetical protein UK23_45070 [Lentzea aerocolonigenes]
MTARLRKPYLLPKTPVGDRLIYEVESGTFEGDRLRGAMHGTSTADWLTIGPDGTATLDVRSVLLTDDGAYVFLHYSGRVDVSNGSGAPLYAAPLFETGDDRYRWLNRVQAVAKGVLDGLVLTYEVCYLR